MCIHQALRKGKPSKTGDTDEGQIQRKAADSIWAAQKRIAQKVNAAQSLGAPAIPIRPKLGFLHMGERHKKWFRGRERTIDDADVVSEVELERLMQVPVDFPSLPPFSIYVFFPSGVMLPLFLKNVRIAHGRSVSG